MNKILIFHGYGSSCENPRYKNLPYPVIAVDVNHSKLSWQEVYEIYDSIITEQLEQKENLIFLGHSLGGWWARFFAKKYNLTAILLNPVIYFPTLTLEILDIQDYKDNFVPFGYSLSCELWYYLELGDEVIDFKPHLRLIEKEGTVITISGGHHKIKNPEIIPSLILAALAGQGTTI